MVKEHDPYVVSKATCKGCENFKSLSGCGGGEMFCSYTYTTGKFKPMDMKCADCTFKVPRKRKNIHCWRGGKKGKGSKK